MAENNNLEYGLQDMNELTITLTLEDDTELLCGVVAIFSAQDKDYIALTPLKDGAAKAFIYRFNQTDSGEPVLECIENDAEFEMANAAFDALIHEDEYSD